MSTMTNKKLAVFVDAFNAKFDTDFTVTEFASMFHMGEAVTAADVARARELAAAR